MKRNLKAMNMLFLAVLISVGGLFGCGSPNRIDRSKAFVEMELNPDTYKEKDEVTLKEERLNYLTDEAYNEYMSNYFGIMYPALFKMYKTKDVDIHKVKCKETVKNADGTQTYTLEVVYTLKSEQEKKTKMTDYFSLTMNQEERITQAVILNTSDVVKKLLLDIKVQ